MIRAFTFDDVDALRRIHSLYFADQFDLPDFMRFLCLFVVEDNEGILTIGGIRSIAECVAVTDLSRSPGDRIRALYQLLDASTFVTRRCGFDQMYAWSQVPKWTNRLKRNGFRPPQGESLIKDL